MSKSVSFLKKDPVKRVFHELEAMLDGTTPIRLESTLLLISRIYHPSLKVESIRKELNVMQADLEPRVAGKSPDAMIKAITAYLHGEKKIENVNEPFMEDFLFHRTLKTKKGRCSSLSALYVILGERLKVPLVAAFAYRHVFARNDKELVCADLSAR